MALLDMKRMTLIAHADQRSAILKELQRIGKVEVISANLDELNEATLPQTLSAHENQLSVVRESLEIIRKYDESKSSFFTPKPAISKLTLDGMHQNFAEADKSIAEIKQFVEDMNALKTRKQKLKNRIVQLEPYAKFDAPLESICPGRYTTCLLGTIPLENLEKYTQICEEYGDFAYFETIDPDCLSVFVVMQKKVHEKLTGELKYIGFAEAYTKELFGKPQDIIFDYQNECDSLEREAQEYEEKAKQFVDDKLLLKALEDYLTNEIARERCIEKLGETGVTFMLEGWIIADEQNAVEKALLDLAPESYLAFKAPAEDETPPTAIKNAKVVSPFEAITDMYSVPSSKGLDPNKLMAFFYFIIFGMMIGDAAYGVILTVGALLLLKLKKPTGMFRKITTVFMICGISTTFWGLFYGTVFSIEGIPSVINPLQGDGAMMTLILCLGIGVVHILVGICIGAYMDIKRGHVLDAIFDRFSWILVLVGGIMLLIGGNLGTIGSYLALAGLAILLFTQGRRKKGIVRKAIGGLASLYDITGYVSDILSYARIFGMGLATTVIAMVFNTIAGLLMGQWFGYIFGIIIMTVGHAFNIAINALGAFVHTARLQYIEFFNKFYEGGGHAFMPLGIRTKNYRLED